VEHIKNPFVALFFPLVFGILFGILTAVKISFLLPLIFIFVVLMLILEKPFFRYKRHFYGFFAYFAVFLLGIYAVQFHRKQLPEINTEKQLFYEGVIVQQPKEKTNSLQTIIKLEAYKGDTSNWQAINTKSIVYFAKDSLSALLKYGDRILFKSYLNEITNAGNPAEFNYKAFMANKAIFTTAFVKTGNFTVLEHNQGSAFLNFAINLQHSLMNIYRKFGIEGQRFAVLSALTLGYRDEVDKETRQMFANTGAMHILAVSGLHVGIIYMILANLLAFMNKKRGLLILKSVIIIGSLWLFAAIAGLSSSVTRAALMFSMFVIGRLLMKNSTIYNIVLASAFILLLINPFDILSVGFQLSYAAVLSIVFFQPYIYDLLVFRRWLPDKIWALLTVSIAAQIGTMPIGLYYFHQFPNYFFITNIVVIPLASIILYVAVLLFIISFVPIISQGVALLLKVLLKLLIGGVAAIDSLPFATTKDIFISPLQVFLIYAIILTFALFWIYNRKLLLYSFLISMLLFLSVDIFINYKNIRTNELLIFNTRKYLTINVLTSDNNQVLANDEVLISKNIINYSLKPYWIQKRMADNQPKELNIDSLIKKDTIVENLFFRKNSVQIGNVKMLILKYNNFDDFVADKKLKIDYLVLTKNVYVKLSELMQFIDFQKVIIASNNKIWRIKKWKQECEELGIPYHDVTTQGAWRIDFVSGREIMNRQ
jgi:competence protein ComEC